MQGGLKPPAGSVTSCGGRCPQGACQRSASRGFSGSRRLGALCLPSTRALDSRGKAAFSTSLTCTKSPGPGRPSYHVVVVVATLPRSGLLGLAQGPRREQAYGRGWPSRRPVLTAPSLYSCSLANVRFDLVVKVSPCRSYCSPLAANKLSLRGH